MVKLNVILITYNQENFIKQTVESILNQKTDFIFNIIVADDASTDSTKSMIESYVSNSNVEFVFLETTKNLGYTLNYKKAFEYCKAPYIAILEGDDFWSSTDHLQRHIYFLDNHPDYVLSFNRHERMFVDKGYNDIPTWTVDGDYETIDPKELALGNRIGNLSCCCLRNIDFDLRIVESTLFADWLLGLYLGLKGKLALLKEVTSTYRVHNNGQWSRMNETEQYHALLRVITGFDPLLNFEYTKEFTLYKKRINVHLYGDKSFKGRIKNILPKKIYNKYKNWRYGQ